MGLLGAARGEASPGAPARGARKTARTSVRGVLSAKPSELPGGLQIMRSCVPGSAASTIPPLAIGIDTSARCAASADSFSRRCSRSTSAPLLIEPAALSPAISRALRTAPSGTRSGRTIVVVRSCSWIVSPGERSRAATTTATPGRMCAASGGALTLMSAARTTRVTSPLFLRTARRRCGPAVASAR